jgi:mannan endo-1,4-beta-mannosidase
MRLLAAASLSMLAFGSQAAPGQSGFVTVKGKHFVLDGKPYYFAGANVWYGMYLGSPGVTGDRARLTRELDQLAAEGVLNLRVLAISEASTLKRAVTPAVIQGPGKVDETLWKGLDFLLDEMAKRDMKAVLYVSNFWQWSGGMSQYVAWFNGKPVLDPDVTGDSKSFMDISAAFESRGFVPPQIRYKSYPGLVRGVILSQTPLAGYRLNPRTAVTFEVSQGS